MYTGRFAPSPTGPLHIGSLVAALASWLDARAAGGRWLVRMEDLDTARCAPDAADDIVRTLGRLGLTWDGDIAWQSRRRLLYHAALERLAQNTYWCGCSRREIADSSLGLAADGAQIYPGTCRDGLNGKPRRALRVRTEAEEIRFHDRVQGPQAQILAREVGDFVVYRADGIVPYQLAVVVDDAEQGITHVVRGADLLDSTARQIHLQKLLGLPTPRYLHIPAVIDAGGEKLSKQTEARPVTTADFPAALRFLGQPPAHDLKEALKNWNASLIPANRAAVLPP